MSLKFNQRKVKNFFINKDIQLKIALTNLAYMASIIFVIIASVLAPLYLDTIDSNKVCEQIIAGKLFVLTLDRLVYGLLIIFIVGFFHQIYITHKFCGPIINFSNTLNLLARGDFTRKIFLRKGDFLKQEGQQINEMIDNLAQIITDSRKANQEILAMLEQSISGEQNDSDPMAAIRQAHEHAVRCNEYLSCFKFQEQNESI